MKDYKRLTNRDLVLTLNYNNGFEDDKRRLDYALRLWELENKIECGEIDYVAELFGKIEQLKSESDNFTVELEVAQRDIDNLTRTLEEANDEIKALEAENSELRETLSKMETVEKELRERLNKAVELPMLQVIEGNRRPYELVYKDQNGRVIISRYRPYDKYEAEARLADLKGDKNDR